MSELRELTMLEVTRSIVGLKKEESEALLTFLLAHVGRGIDYQARVRWAPKTVVVWDVSYRYRD
jgi:alpha-ketoglutarate-dependent taurine dioxygenase